MTESLDLSPYHAAPARRRLWLALAGAIVLVAAGLAAAQALGLFARPHALIRAASAQDSRERNEFEALIRIEVPPSVEPLALKPLELETARQINDATPFADIPNPAAAPFHLSGTDLSRTRALACLASAQWYEAGGDWEGQKAVAQVVLNRVRHPSFPHSVCEVVFQGAERQTGCQFTFTCDGALARRPSDAAWQRSVKIAASMLDGEVYRKVGLATHYHTDWVVPYWSSSLDKIAKVQTHLFFKWKGGWGKTYAFRAPYSGVEPPVSKIAFLEPLHRRDAADGEQLADLTPNDGETGTNQPEMPNFGVAMARQRDPALNDVDMRGSNLELVHPQGGAYAVRLSASAAPGSYAMMALGLCKGRAFCKVMGWLDDAAMPTRFPIPPAARDQMSFLYIHDQRSGQEVVLWNCARIKRPRATECLTPESTRWDTLAGQGEKPEKPVEPIPVPVAALAPKGPVAE